MKRLRVPPLGDQQSPWTTFKVIDKNSSVFDRPWKSIKLYLQSMILVKKIRFCSNMQVRKNIPNSCLWVVHGNIYLKKHFSCFWIPNKFIIILLKRLVFFPALSSCWSLRSCCPPSSTIWTRTLRYPATTGGSPSSSIEVPFSLSSLFSSWESMSTDGGKGSISQTFYEQLLRM